MPESKNGNPTYADILNDGERRLRIHSCVGADASHEAIELLGIVEGSKGNLIAHLSEKADLAHIDAFDELVSRRLAHEPMGYLLGSSPFFGRDFRVTHDVLIPRPATELIVEAALAVAKGKDADLLVDAGTGSGAVAVTLAAECPETEVLATEISEAALDVARGNAERLGVADRIGFREGDVLDPIVDDLKGRTAVIVANLPYIPSPMMKTLDPDVKDHEPRLALDGGEDGLDLYRRLLDRLNGTEDADITVFMEILPEQYESLEREVRDRIPDAHAGPLKNGDAPLALRMDLKR